MSTTANPPKRKMTRAEWKRTPYATSEVRDPDGAVNKLLAKHGIGDIQWTMSAGVARPVVQLRFLLKGRCYRLKLEGLHADASPAELAVQVKRAMFHTLKALLEMVNIWFTAEEALFSFIELADGTTVFEAARPHMGTMTTPGFGQLLLPGRQ